jgi:hypothetical protein
MEPKPLEWLNQPPVLALIARGRQTGSLTYDEINAVLPSEPSHEDLERLLEVLESQGISVIDEPDDSDSPATPVPEEPAPPVPESPYHRDAAFEQRLRGFGVPFSDAMVSHDPATGLVFDAELIVPGDRALATWLLLRNAVPLTGLWPVIERERNEANYDEDRPYPLDPGGRRYEWEQAWRRDRTLPSPELTPEVIRADAAANIAASDKVPPTPWTFRSRAQRRWAPPVLSEPDAPLPITEPNLPELFANEGPFRTVRLAFGGDWPFYPFMRIRLYPTRVPWEVFAYSPYGGWNDCPWPDEQLAVLRHWHTVCGTELVSIRNDWYELFVPRPPRTRHQAIEILHTHCGDERSFHVPEGAGLLEALAAAHYWHFWWD